MRVRVDECTSRERSWLWRTEKLQTAASAFEWAFYDHIHTKSKTKLLLQKIRPANFHRRAVTKNRGESRKTWRKPKNARGVILGKEFAVPPDASRASFSIPLKTLSHFSDTHSHRRLFFLRRRERDELELLELLELELLPPPPPPPAPCNARP